MGGVELTTHFGHALVLGTRAWEEWRANSMAGVAMPALCEARTREGKLFVIAHPMSPGDRACTGCRWDYADMRPAPPAPSRSGTARGATTRGRARGLSGTG